METAKDKAGAASVTKLGDETFMTADDLREYMTEMQMARASKELGAMNSADKARQDLIKMLSAPLDLTPDRLKEIAERLMTKLRTAAQGGESEILVMRFPVALCTDQGRAINNGDADWPETLTGRPRQAYELWRDRLRPAGYRLKAMIIEWPGGMPGDVGFFLAWGGKTP